MKKLFLLFVALSVLLFSFAGGGGSSSSSSGGGKKSSDDNTNTLPEVVPVISSPIYLQFFNVNNKSTPPTHGYHQRPYFSNYYFDVDSETTLNSYSNRYYCQIKIEGDNYSRIYTWKKGSFMNVEIPTDRTYTIIVHYYEPWACPIYTYSSSPRGSSCRVQYSYQKSFIYYQANYFVDFVTATYYY